MKKAFEGGGILSLTKSQRGQQTRSFDEKKKITNVQQNE